MKVLGGTLKGRNFFMPAAIRPTQDSLRAAIFDILGHDFSDLRFLDLFSGSGAVGFEAISRGAREAVFVEKDATNAGIIQENFDLLKLGYPHPFHRVINADVFASIKNFARKNERFDVVFFDPPFDLKLAKKTLKHLMAYDILHAHSFVVGQFGRDDSLPEDLKGDLRFSKNDGTEVLAGYFAGSWGCYPKVQGIMTLKRQAAIYPGSFDPVTFGHLDVIKRAKRIFPLVYVAVADNTSKQAIFTIEERVALLKKVTKGMKGIVVESFDTLVIEYAHKKNINVLIRGLRMTSDFEYEFQIALTNRRLAQDIETVFLMPSENHSFVSSSLLKEVASLDADISSFVPKVVEVELKKIFEEMLKFSVRDILKTGLSVHQSVTPADIGFSKDDLDLRSDLDVQVNLNRIGDTVLADAVVSVSYGFQCARCLEDFQRAKVKEYHFDYEVKGNMDVYNVGEDIRQEMILGVVQRALCKNDCKGICAGCGVNLNIEQCKCKK